MSTLETVVFTRPEVRDSATGDRPEGSTAVAEVACRIEPVTATDVPGRSSDQKRATFRLYATDPDLAVQAKDVATFRGDDHQVAGDPERWARTGCVITVWRSVG